MSSSFPLRRSVETLCLLSLLVLSGCGGGEKAAPKTQTVAGVGYRFEAPISWKVTRAATVSAAESGEVDRVEVRTYRLARAYNPALFEAAQKELDSVIERIAQQLSGRVTSRQTISVSGGKARSYRIAYDGRAQQITFVLRGRQEHQLLCRRRADEDDTACAQLLATFALR